VTASASASASTSETSSEACCTACTALFRRAKNASSAATDAMVVTRMLVFVGDVVDGDTRGSRPVFYMSRALVTCDSQRPSEGSRTSLPSQIQLISRLHLHFSMTAHDRSRSTVVRSKSASGMLQCVGAHNYKILRRCRPFATYQNANIVSREMRLTHTAQ